MMDNQPDQFSQLITSVFAKFGINPPFMETILLRDRFYLGRKFRAGGFQVVWWIEKNVVEAFNEDGQSVESVSLEQESRKSA
jgi:hypothetical protein